MAPEWYLGNTVAEPDPRRSCKHVASMLQACCRHVAGMLQACCRHVTSLFKTSLSSFQPCPQAEHWCGPTSGWRSVPQPLSIEYRRQKSCPGYRDWTDFKLACATHSGLERSRDGGTDEGAKPKRFGGRARTPLRAPPAHPRTICATRPRDAPTRSVGLPRQAESSKVD